MARSTKKGFFVDPKLLDKVRKAQGSASRKPIRTWSRRSMITPDFIGVVLEIHNGRKFEPLHVTDSMVGHRCGEFAPTRTFKGHSVPTQKVQK